ncbi:MULTISPECIES: type IV toxin-antitoxin system AbiEi family antitoxin domain-containing protein [Yersiniaceae]|uniref:Type IV toxin-antitoxin system AbiEi family antitoxin n=1 Tax=Nissabacter archeti TaxID=1917880 RepID=A0ABS5JN42_9GAMM|nr:MULTISPECIES: type IV toxin-antitoxin system AbiEi family antitoxin domain-containing protein [Yersiniaceae]MBS0970748.1 type IV toxin-antitoxin system AbiEi family antitoxin [Nissabacter archeti]MDV5142046.1 type IV toxin-antitoxin system AbiEi family antitoxin domain-containing protein [Chimaeribacter arupi]
MLNSESRQLLKTLLPVGLLATKAWLQAQGLTLHFIDNAVKSRTLLALVPGVYVREEPCLSWQGVTISLQRMQSLPVQVGGLTALDLAGLAHYQSRHKDQLISLYSAGAAPPWLNRLNLSTQFEWHSTRRIWPAPVMDDARYLRAYPWREGLPALMMSGPEKAMLELLPQVPEHLSVEHADQLMQGLSTLSPRKLDPLMQANGSIKSKRLFMWLAQRHNHPWYRHLNPTQYALGTGKRAIVQAGRLDTTWNITVPKEM